MTYRVFSRRAKNWREFAAARKHTVRAGLTETQARQMCCEHNAQRPPEQVRNGAKWEYESEAAASTRRWA